MCFDFDWIFGGYVFSICCVLGYVFFNDCIVVFRYGMSVLV